MINELILIDRLNLFLTWFFFDKTSSLELLELLTNYCLLVFKIVFYINMFTTSDNK